MEQMEQVDFAVFCRGDSERLPSLQGQSGHCSWQRNAMWERSCQPVQYF